VVVLVFSKDRAMQLEGLLASLFLHCREQEEIKIIVLYTCSHEETKGKYKEIMENYPRVLFWEELNFFIQVRDVLKQSPFVLFLVDDTLWVGDFSPSVLKSLLSTSPQAAGISLRLGKNITYCYPLDRPQALPFCITQREGFLLYDWLSASLDFAYPLEVSSSCYRTQDILAVLQESVFKNPNELEGLLANFVVRLLPDKRLLFCPEQSLAFSVPVNRVQNAVSNRFSYQPDYEVDKLDVKFAEGWRIDVEKLSGFVPQSCHQPLELPFKRVGEEQTR